MVKVPASIDRFEFVMGARPDEQGKYPNEEPEHPVTIRRDFAVGKYEVTRAQFAAFVEATGFDAENGCQIWASGFEKDRKKSWRDPGFPQQPDMPVVCVDWFDAKAYVEWLRQRTGQPYRLLSEAEWEYAARAWTATRYWWGDHFAEGRANCSDCGSVWDLDRTAPVGGFVPNFFGLYDMNGNVWEWVEDCWHESYEGAPDDGSAWVEGECKRRTLRGGSWVEIRETLRSANRLRNGADNRNNAIGFRVAKDLWPAPPE